MTLEPPFRMDIIREVGELLSESKDLKHAKELFIRKCFEWFGLKQILDFVEIKLAGVFGTVILVEGLIFCIFVFDIGI